MGCNEGGRSCEYWFCDWVRCCNILLCRVINADRVMWIFSQTRVIDISIAPLRLTSRKHSVWWQFICLWWEDVQSRMKTRTWSWFSPYCECDIILKVECACNLNVLATFHNVRIKKCNIIMICFYQETSTMLQYTWSLTTQDYSYLQAHT